MYFTEVEPISTYIDFGEREFLVADERGYEHLLYKMAETFLLTAEGEILDTRLKLNKVNILVSVYNLCRFYFLSPLNELIILRKQNTVFKFWKKTKVNTTESDYN